MTAGVSEDFPLQGSPLSGTTWFILLICCKAYSLECGLQQVCLFSEHDVPCLQFEFCALISVLLAIKVVPGFLNQHIKVSSDYVTGPEAQLLWIMQ